MHRQKTQRYRQDHWGFCELLLTNLHNQLIQKKKLVQIEAEMERKPLERLEPLKVEVQISTNTLTEKAIAHLAFIYTPVVHIFIISSIIQPRRFE